MEAAVLSGFLKIVGNKLAPLLMNEYNCIVGAKKDLQKLHDQVVEINNWLESLGDEAVGNDPSLNWLKELKDIAYEVDDIVDEFQLKAEKHDIGGDGGIVSKYLCNKPESIIFQCKVATEIKAIKKKFAAIVKQRNDFSAITKSSPVGHLVCQMNITIGEMPLLPNIDAASVLGRDKEKHDLISRLVETKDQQIINIVSIIGLGGSGKTTLAKLVFNDDGIIEKHFEVKLWVHVSQEFDIAKLVGKLFEALDGEKSEQHTLQKMSKIIAEKLTGKRYLLVLDDMWTDSKDLIKWEQFIVHLQSGTPGSAILLTTRSREVAATVKSTHQFNLPFLSLGDSWQLFQQSIKMHPQGSDPEFVEVGEEIVKKCGGLPLAIKVLAGALRGKERIEEWQTIRDSNLLDVNGEEHGRLVFACLRLSYFHLPSHLKQCFTLCSVFPKGYLIDKEQLIDQWIAHDMITPEPGVDDLEYIGHKYFSYLVQMSFLQDVNEVSGRVRCRMHDLVHDLARAILGDEISFILPKEVTKSKKRYRYFSLIDHPRNLPTKDIFEKARAFYVATSHYSIFGKELKNAKHLRSLIIMEDDILGSLCTITLRVKNLRYLSTSKSLWRGLPVAISDLWSLRSLYVTGCWNFHELPESIGNLKNLTTLNLSDCRRLESLPDSLGDCHRLSRIVCNCDNFLKLPSSIGKLQKLKTLNLSQCGKLECLPDSIGDCHMMSSIDLCSCKNLRVLPNSIGKLNKLKVLNLSQCGQLQCLPDGIGDCQMISSMDLCNCKQLTVLPNSIGKLKKLKELNLSQCGKLKCLPDSIGDCHMISSIDLCNCKQLTVLPNSIGKLKKLKTLNLSWCGKLKCLPDSIGDCHMISSIDMCNCKKLTVLPNSISGNKNLRVLRLGNTKIEKLPSSITTLRNLECLDLHGCKELVELPEGIGNLENLEVLNLDDCEKLGGMPVGIGKLSQLQKLGLYVVGDSEREKFAGTSELANLSGISEELSIRVISHGMDPDGAHKACLKEKTNLKRLDLWWIEHEVGEVNTGLEQAVFDGLEPPPGIETLGIHRYPGQEYARWMQNQVGDGAAAAFSFLREMRLCDFPSLKNLHGLVELPCLQELYLVRMPRVESISGGPFPSLCRLQMYDLPSLGEVWMVVQTERTSDGEEDQVYKNCTPNLGQVLLVGNYLEALDIDNCPKLNVKPHLPCSLQRWSLSGSSEQLLQSPSQCESYNLSCLKKLDLERMTGLGYGRGWGLLQHMTALESLDISSDELTELPECLRSLTFLRSLKLWSCSAIHQLPESVGELHSLQELSIQYCEYLSSLPQTLGGLTSLQVLTIRWCPALGQLPDCLGELCALRALDISGAPRIKSLPEGIKDLTALQRLWISGCPDLAMRCKKGTGEDWHLISHIPHLRIRKGLECALKKVAKRWQAMEVHQGGATLGQTSSFSDGHGEL